MSSDGGLLLQHRWLTRVCTLKLTLPTLTIANSSMARNEVLDPTLFSMLGFDLSRACVGFEHHSVSTIMSSYAQVFYCIQKIMFPSSFSLRLSLTFLSDSIPQWALQGRELDIHVLFRDENSEIYSSLHLDHCYFVNHHLLQSRGFSDEGREVHWCITISH